MPQNATIVDVRTPGGAVRVYIPPPESEGPGPAKRLPEPIETEGELVSETIAPVIPLRRSA